MLGIKTHEEKELLRPASLFWVYVRLKVQSYFKYRSKYLAVYEGDRSDITSNEIGADIN